MQRRQKNIFITNLKKNLPYEELKEDFFKPNKKLHEFENHVTFLDSNSECLINNFEAIEDSINTYFKNQKIFYKVKTAVNSIKKHKDNADFKSIINEQKNNFRTKIEPVFRRKIEKFLKENYPNRQLRISANESPRRKRTGYRDGVTILFFAASGGELHP